MSRGCTEVTRIASNDFSRERNSKTPCIEGGVGPGIPEKDLQVGFMNGILQLLRKHRFYFIFRNINRRE